LKFWVNIDKPTECYLHADTCGQVLKEETPLKGINEEKAEGGWFSFNSKEEANDFLAKRFPDKNLLIHACVHSE
jgi:hypothetical protein